MSELVRSPVNERSAREWFLNLAVREGIETEPWKYLVRLVEGRDTLVRINHVKREATQSTCTQS